MALPDDLPPDRDPAGEHPCQNVHGYHLLGLWHDLQKLAAVAVIRQTTVLDHDDVDGLRGRSIDGRTDLPLRRRAARICRVRVAALPGCEGNMPERSCPRAVGMT